MATTITTRKCYECKRNMVGRRANYLYSECGLSSVTLLDIVVFHCECGAIVPEIPAPGELHNCIAMSVLKKQTLLSGEEIRFVRKIAGYSGTDLARALGMQKTSVSHWENESKKIGKDSDRLVRLICFARMVERMSGGASEGDLVPHLLRTARMFNNLNLTSIIETIEDRASGSEPVRINPEVLSACSSASEAVTPEPVLQ